MTVTAQYAEEHLSELFEAADRGEEVEISRGEKSMLKLVAAPKEEVSESGRKRVLGSLRGVLQVPSDEEWLEMDRGLEHLMNDMPLMTSGEI